MTLGSVGTRGGRADDASGRLPDVRFRGVIEAAGRGGATVPLPFDPKGVFGKARAPVRGTVNGAPFRSTVAIYGGVAYLGVTKGLREEAGADIGDEVDVEIELDDAPREVDVPPELAAVLERDAEAARAFEKLSYTHRKEYARWIAEAKRAETKQRRIAKVTAMLREGIPTPDASSSSEKPSRSSSRKSGPR
jgi:Bacteriocin-protection, YdeI or OmpD-Associated/Domain of unknown function (DUF1905)